MPRPRRLAPREQVDGWPDLAADQAEVEAMRLLALRLREATSGQSGREVGRATGVDFTVVNDILAGASWPDVLTVLRLELGLGVRLWPSPDDWPPNRGDVAAAGRAG